MFFSSLSFFFFYLGASSASFSFYLLFFFLSFFWRWGLGLWGWGGGSLVICCVFGVGRKQVTHSTFALGLARVLDMIFWVYSYQELTSHAGSHSVGMFVLFSQFVHIVIMGDFFYYYAIRSVCWT